MSLTDEQPPGIPVGTVAGAAIQGCEDDGAIQQVL